MPRPDSFRNPNLVADALASSEVEDRRQATSLLGALEVSQALPLLVRALGDDDWRVRKEATMAGRALLAKGPPGSRELVQELVRWLGAGDNVGLRNAAVDVLAAAGAVATPALSVALATLDADGRKLAVEALGRSRDPSALEALASALADVDQNVRQAAIEAVAALGPLAPERASALLMEALDEPAAVIRLTALGGLTSLGVAVPWPKLGPLLAEPTLRGVALDAAALSDAPEAAVAVVRALDGAGSVGADDGGFAREARSRPQTPSDDGGFAREARSRPQTPSDDGGFAREARSRPQTPAAFSHAIDAVARLAEGPRAHEVAEALVMAGPSLGERLVAVVLRRDAEPIERRRDALGLAALARAPGLLDAAVGALGEELLADRAQEALRGLGAAALPALVARIARGGQAAATSVSRAEFVDAAAAIAAEEDPARVPWSDLLTSLRGAAMEPERRLASSALVALARLGTQDDLELLARATSTEDRAVAHAAEGALARLASRFPDAARAVAESAGSDEANILAVATVLGALAAIGAERDGDARYLANAATAGRPAARRAAVAAVAEIGGPAAMEVLSFALADEEHEVQLAAARGLGHLSATSTRMFGRDTIPDAHDLLSSPEGSSDRAPFSHVPPHSSRRPGEVLKLVERSGAPDLVAAAVRAIGDALAVRASEAEATSATGDDDAHVGLSAQEDLLYALASFARHASSAVALASVDAIALAAEGPGAAAALAAGLEHPDEDVARSALLKLASRSRGSEAVLSALGHASPGVRILAAETLARPVSAPTRAELQRRLALEQDLEVKAAIEEALAAGPGSESELRERGAHRDRPYGSESEPRDRSPHRDRGGRH